jgi:signal transduction histidine kinase
VAVTLQGSPEQVRLGVVDDGPGIVAADRERVFERFTRLDGGRGRGDGGTGLGLAIVRELVLAHGGSVRIQDRPDGGRGARFEVLLPAAPPM